MGDDKKPGERVVIRKDSNTERIDESAVPSIRSVGPLPNPAPPAKPQAPPPAPPTPAKKSDQ